MSFEMGVWRVDGEPRRLTATGMPSEKALEDLIEKDPAILGQRLMIIGRQVHTENGKVVDLLAIDLDGALHVLELKRDRTPRDIVAQILDYGAWVQALSRDQIGDLFSRYQPGQDFDAAFDETFGRPAESVNSEHHLTIVAAELDSATERIIGYLNVTHRLPINVVFFRYYADGEREYLARSWLLDAAEVEVKVGATTATSRTTGPWNGQDWYVSFGEYGRSWQDARRYGFVSAGGGEWYSRTIKNPPVGARVFVCIPQAGYVGIGEVTGPATTFDIATVQVEGQTVRLAEQKLSAPYRHELGEEWVLPVRWIAPTRDRSDPVWAPGMFANQNSACKLRRDSTIQQLTDAFGLTGTS